MAYSLFNFFVYGHFLQDRIVLFLLQTIRSVFAILGCDITAGARHARLFVLGALHNHLNSISFLCHCLKNLEWGRECTAFFPLTKQNCNVFLTGLCFPKKASVKIRLFFSDLEKKEAV
jgi:hypothetical protein